MRAHNSHSRLLIGWITAALFASLLAVGTLPPTVDGFGAAPSAAAVTEPFIDVANLDPVPERMWGVSGIDPTETQTSTLDVLVWDLVQIGDRMFVGGAFLNVQEDKYSTPISQSFVAAFDIRTGDWIDTWRPQLDRAVYSLENFNGTLLVGGEFESVNGKVRAGLVGLDPLTGNIDPTFSGHVERPWSGLRANVRDLKVDGNNVYVVGNFSHINGAGGERTRVYKAVRLVGQTGAIDTAWKPEVTGSGVWGVDLNPSNTEVYLTGYFSAVNGEADTGNFHTVDTTNGASVGGKIETPRNHPAIQPEFFDVAYGDNNVFIAGEQHIVQVLRESDQQMLGFYTTGHSADQFDWAGGFAGGAYQAADAIGDWVVAGCHCTYSTRNGRVNHYSSFSDQRTPHRLLMIYDAATGDLYEPFQADVNSPADGSWTFAGDTFGCLWTGGDFHVGGVDHGVSRWVGGMARFCPTDFDPNAEPDPEPDQNVLLESGSEWSYDDSGSDLGVVWRAASYDDAGWPTGAAEFGFGDGDESTLLTKGAITYYARTTFDFSGPTPASLDVSLKADDGAVVYLNGVELLRDNMPAGTISASTPSIGWKGGADEVFVDYVVPADALVDGQNVLAVEVHNVWRNNNDLSFDLSVTKSDAAASEIASRFVEQNADWRYIEDATSTPIGWTAGIGGDDEGAAPLGFGENFIATTLTSGQMSYYFSRTFEVEDPDTVSDLILSLLADDGAVVYLNEQEVHRVNLPDGSIEWATAPTAWVSGQAEKTYFDTTIAPDALVAGTNTIAVEVHNFWAGNSDLTFDLSLIESEN